jgi:excisionase family DNA binding protein
MSEEERLTLQEAAKELNISENTARRWVKSGKLKAFQPGRRYLVPVSAVEDLLKPAESPALEMSDEQFTSAVREADEGELSEMMDDVGRYLPQQGEHPSRRSAVAIHRCLVIARERKARAAADEENLEKLQIA